MTKKLFFAAVLGTAFLFISCRTSSQMGSGQTVDDMMGTVWLAESSESLAGDSVPLHGFILADNGSFIGINPVDIPAGITWDIREGALVLSFQDGAATAAEPHFYPFRLKDETLTLFPEKNRGRGVTFVRAEAPFRIPAGEWILTFLNNTGGLKTPRTDLPDLYIRRQDGVWQMSGFGGVNRYFGTLKLDNGRWNSGPTLSTMMSGPYLDYEQLYFRTLEEAERYLVLDDQLFLYKGAEISAVYRRKTGNQ